MQLLELKADVIMLCGEQLGEGHDMTTMERRQVRRILAVTPELAQCSVMCHLTSLLEFVALRVVAGRNGRRRRRLA